MVRVIICEDDPIQCLDLVEHVMSTGGEVCGVFRASVEALHAAKEIRPDLAIIDLTLEDGETGAGLAVELAKLGCRIVILSGDDSVQSKLAGIAHTFVAKPLPMQVVGELTSMARPGQA